MRRIIAGLCGILLSAGASAESAKTFEGWSVAAGSRYASIDGNHPVMPGVAAFLHLTGGARLGLEYWQTLGDVSLHYGPSSQLGANFTRLYPSQEMVSLYNELFVGAGSLQRKANMFSQYDKVTDQFMIFEPGLGLELAMSKTLSLQAGMRYRWVTRVDIVGTDEQDLSGLSLQLLLRWQPGAGQESGLALPGELDPQQQWPTELY